MAADLAIRFVIATAQHSPIFDQPTPRKYTDEELAQHLAGAVRRYLLGAAEGGKRRR